MKRYLIGLTLFVSIGLAFNISVFTYASSFAREESATSYGYSKIDSNVVLRQILDLKNINVKFTQNDNSYIFHITGNASFNVYGTYGKTIIGTYTNSPAPLLYKEENFGNGLSVSENGKSPFADYKNGDLYKNTSLNILGRTIANFNSSYTLKSNGSITNRVFEKWNNGERYFIPNSLRNNTSARSHNFSGSTSFPYNCDNNGAGVSILQNSSSHHYTLNDVTMNRTRCIDTFTIYVNCKISINKNYINDYKYVCFAQSFAFLTSQSVSSLIESASGISVCTQTIDLKEYVNCDHEWAMLMGDKTNHNRYCKLCEWTKTEPHELLYEYDGIKNNVCTCSYIDKVNYNFKINDDNLNELTTVLDSNSPYTKYEFTSKKGYKFKYYKKYEKRLLSSNNLSTISNTIYTEFISTCSELDDETGMCSVIYNAEYDVNKFTFIYSSINNKNLKLNSMIEPQIIYYDEKAYLKKNAKLGGYAFKGWTLTLGSEQVDLAPKQEITNYTDVDLTEITIYPIYKNLDFTIAYSSGRGSFSDGSKYKEIKYTYFDNSELEWVHLNSSEDYMKYYMDQNGNKFETMAQVKKYLDDNELDDYIVKLIPVFGRDEYSNPENNDDGKAEDEVRRRADPKSGPGFVDDNVDNIIVDFDFINNSSIYGMSDSSKDDGNKGKGEMFGPPVASMSFIKKPDINDRDIHYKLKLLLLFIKNNLLLFSICCSLLILLIILYVILVIKHYKKQLQDVIY